MDIQHLIDFILAAIMAAIGWASKTIYGAVKALEIDLAAHKVEVARDYATNADLQNIDKKLDRILERLSK